MADKPASDVLLRKEVLDSPALPFAELLAFTRLTRGTVEGYIKRGIVVLEQNQPKGRGHHRRYTGREAIRFYTVFLLTKAGLSPSATNALINPGKKYRDFYSLSEELQAEIIERCKRDGSPLPVRRTPKELAETTPAWVDKVIDSFISDGENSKFATGSPLACNPTWHFGVETGPLLVFFDDQEKLSSGMREEKALTYMVVDLHQIVRDFYNALRQHLEDRNREQEKQ